MPKHKAQTVRSSSRTILLDSNLLLVLLIGAYDPLRLQTFKRVSGFTLDDYDLLVNLLESYSTLLTTPHILTEVSNLANSLPEPIRTDWFRSFSAWLQAKDATPGLREHYTPADRLAGAQEFSAFGITDTAIRDLSSEALILTEDHRLSGVLRQKGASAMSFDDLRKMANAAEDSVL